MHATIRPYVTAGVALVGACAIAVTPVVAAPPDVAVTNPAVALTASPVGAYEALFDNSVRNVEGLVSLALDPTPTLPFTLNDLISQAVEVDANIAAFRLLVSGLPSQISGLEQLTNMFFQAASNDLQAGNFEDVLDVLLYTALFNGTGVLGIALYPAALLGVDVEEVTPEFAGGILNAAVAPVLSGFATTGQVTQDVLDAAKAGSYQQIPGDLIAAPAVIGNGVLNGTDLETSVFGPVAIPGILTDATFLDPEGPGPISLGLQLVLFTRGLVTPPAATSTLRNTPPATASAGGEPKSVVDVDAVTNAGTRAAASPKKTGQPRIVSSRSERSQNGSSATGLKNIRQGVRDGIQGLRDGVRDVVKNLTGRGTSADQHNDVDKPSE